MALNTMEVTHKGLSTVSSILINDYVYNGNITTHGHVNVTPTGIASQFNNENYIHIQETYSDLSSVTVRFAGKYMVQDLVQTAFYLKLSSGSVFVTLIGTSITARIAGATEYSSVTIRGLDFSNTSDISVALEITSSSATLTVTVDSNIYASTEAIDLTSLGVAIDSISDIYIGAFSNGLSPWLSSIDLSKFFILDQKEIVYSPTTKKDITFTDIVVATKKFELEDDTTEVLNKAMKFEIEKDKIKRTNSNVLLQVTIPEDAYLTIASIGIYCDICGKRTLFSKIENLDIKKSKDIPYNLLFHVKLDVNIVNTVVMPEIEVKSAVYPYMSELEEIKKVFLYTNTDLERIIKANAKQIGFNTAQVFYQKERKIAYTEELWTSALRALTFLKAGIYRPLDYFTFPNALKHTYTLKNLIVDTGSDYISILDNAFLGANSSIDFSKPTSLVLKLKPMELTDKLLLAKLNFSSSDMYFSISIQDISLVFKLYTEDDIIETVIPFNDNNKMLFSNSNLISVVSSPLSHTLSIYLNESLLTSIDTTDVEWLDVSSGYSIANYLGLSTITAAENYLDDILYFNSPLAQEELYNVGVILGCTHRESSDNSSSNE